MFVSTATRAIRNTAVAAAILPGFGASAGMAKDGAPPFTGPVAAASGQADETLFCSLLYVPAIAQVFDDGRIGRPAPATMRTDRYANLEISYLVFDSGDLDHPVIVGSFWNGKDRPPTSRVEVPFAPPTSGASQVLALSLDHRDKLAGPDFDLVCDVIADGSVMPRRVPGIHKVGDVTLKRGVFSGDRVFFNYAYFHNAVADTRVDVRVLYAVDAPHGTRKAKPGRCPIVTTDVTVVDGATLEPFDGALSSATLAPGDTFGHTIGIGHEHQPPTNSPAVPVLVVLRHTAQTGMSPHCALFPSVEVTAGGITRNIDVEDWEKTQELRPGHHH
jgi:hypothetical protein